MTYAKCSILLLMLAFSGCGGDVVCKSAECAPSYNQDSEGYPEIYVSPDTIDFGRFAPGVKESAVVRVENVWGPTLEIETIEIVEQTRDDPGGIELQLIESGSRVLESGESMTLEVIYEPGDEAADEGFLRIDSNAGTDPAVFVSIASTLTHCSRTTPDRLDFGEVAIGESAMDEVELENCNPDVPLRVTNLFVGRHANLFTIETSGFDEQDGELFVPPDSTATVSVRFSPSDEIEYASRLAVFTEDRDNDQTVELSGVGIMSR